MLQSDFVTGPLISLAACDVPVFTHETTRDVAANHGLKVIFVPLLPYSACRTCRSVYAPHSYILNVSSLSTRSGTHVHISTYK